MDRQPLTPALLSLLALAACEDEIAGPPWFDGPVGAAVLNPDDGGPFDEPVGFVANSRSGTIVPIDVKHVSLLADIPGAPFAAPRQIATGDERQLDQIAVIGGDDESVTLYAADLHYSVLVEAPYLVGSDPFPERYTATNTDPTFVDADGSGESPSLGEIELRAGSTTTEDWSVEHDGEGWWVKGTRSGQQTARPTPDEPYCSDRRELCFTLSGQATAGDRFELRTDAGVVEHDLGGQILGLARLPGHDLLVAAVWDGTRAEGHLSFFDTLAHAELGRLSLGAGAMPWRVSFDDSGSQIFIGDADAPVVYGLTLNEDDPTASPVSTLETAAPVSALAWSDTESGPRLFVGLSELDRIDVYDLDGGAWVDVNAMDEAVEGVYVHSPIVGMAATHEVIQLQEHTSWDASYEAPAVMVSTAAGEVRMLNADTGCFATQAEGPKLSEDSSGIAWSWNDSGDASDVDMLSGYESDQLDSEWDGLVAVNPCGGVAQGEAWTVIYDGATGTWEVEGTRSGVQQNVARTFERYVSDHGEISFTLVEGSLPPTSGDAFAFDVDDGVLRVSTLTEPSGSEAALRQPAPPVVFTVDEGRTGGGWDPLLRRTYTIVPVTNLDLVLRLGLDGWGQDWYWQ